MKKSRLNQSGFSLIELMVVVAIIGILAAIGIPQYSKFQAKTRQSEAKSSLSSLYTAEVSFMGEWNKYTINLRNIGFGATGSRLRYVTGFFMADGVSGGCTGYPITPTDGSPAEGTTAATTILQNINTRSTTCGSTVNVGSSPATFLLPSSFPLIAGPPQACNVAAPAGAAYTTATTAVTGTVCNAATGTQAFRAFSIGDPNANVAANMLDGWSIDHLKTLSNSTPGIQ